MTGPQDKSEDEALAAEYVLRLLAADAERDFEARLAGDPALRAQVRFWEAEFAALAEETPDAPPPAAAKARLLAAIDGPAIRPARHWAWGWLAIPSVLAVALAVFFAVMPALRGPAFDPAFHASLASADGSLRIEAGYAPDGMLFKVIHEAGTPRPGRDYELWVIGEGASAPVSLGVISYGQETTFEIGGDIAALIDGGTLAVSDEPEGGSPTGAPTGEILATDAFFDI